MNSIESNLGSTDQDEQEQEQAAVKPRKASGPARAKARGLADPPLSDSPRVRIVLEENDNIPPTGLFVGVNGRSFLVRAGEEVEVPVEVVEALNDAVESVPRTDASGNIVDYRNRLRFPYRLLAG